MAAEKSENQVEVMYAVVLEVLKTGEIRIWTQQGEPGKIEVFALEDQPVPSVPSLREGVDWFERHSNQLIRNLREAVRDAG